MSDPERGHGWREPRVLDTFPEELVERYGEEVRRRVAVGHSKAFVFATGAEP